MPFLDDLLIRHLGPSMAKRRALLEGVEGLPCKVDLARGEARFGDRYRFDVQYLGREDLRDGSWRWSWAERPPPPAGVAAAARELRAYGEEHDLDLFTEPVFDASEVTGDTIAVLACGIAGSEALFSVREGDVALYLLVPSLGGLLPAARSARFVVEVAVEMLESYELPDQRAALSGLLAHEGYRVEEEGSHRWVASHPAGHEISASFDRLGRLKRIETHEG